AHQADLFGGGQRDRALTACDRFDEADGEGVIGGHVDGDTTDPNGLLGSSSQAGGGTSGEGENDDLGGEGASGVDDPGYPSDEELGLPGPRSRHDDLSAVTVVEDRVPVVDSETHLIDHPQDRRSQAATGRSEL